MNETLHWSARWRRIWDNLFTSRYERHLKAEIERLTELLDLSMQKCERLERAMMPATPAGARYVNDLRAPQIIPDVGPRPGTWAWVEAEHEKELAELEKADKEKANGNGVQAKAV